MLWTSSQVVGEALKPVRGANVKEGLIHCMGQQGIPRDHAPEELAEVGGTRRVSHQVQSALPERQRTGIHPASARAEFFVVSGHPSIIDLGVTGHFRHGIGDGHDAQRVWRQPAEQGPVVDVKVGIP
jgi:hypothetical protein